MSALRRACSGGHRDECEGCGLTPAEAMHEQMMKERWPARDRAYGRCLAEVRRKGDHGRRRCFLPAPKGYGTCHVHRAQEHWL